MGVTPAVIRSTDRTPHDGERFDQSALPEPAFELEEPSA